MNNFFHPRPVIAYLKEHSIKRDDMTDIPMLPKVQRGVKNRLSYDGVIFATKKTRLGNEWKEGTTYPKLMRFWDSMEGKP